MKKPLKKLGKKVELSKTKATEFVKNSQKTNTKNARKIEKDLQLSKGSKRLSKEISNANSTAAETGLKGIANKPLNDAKEGTNIKK